MVEKLAPIILFTYNRLEETKQTILALQNNYLAKDSELFVFSDGSKNKSMSSKIQAVRDYLKSVEGFKRITIYESDVNKGLAKSIIEGVSKMLVKYNKVIVMEDDLVSTPNFLDFMNQALFFYKDIPNVMSINGFSLKINHKIKNTKDTFLMNRTYSWGWATWKDCWESCEFDRNRIYESLNSHVKRKFKYYCGQDSYRMLLDSLNGVNDSWYIRWVYAHFCNSKLAVYPFKSKIKNIGYGDDATHCNTIDVLSTTHDLNFKKKFDMESNVNVNPNLRFIFLNYFTYKHKLLIRLKMMFNANYRPLLLKDFKQKLNNFSKKFN